MSERDGPKVAREIRDSILRLEMKPGDVLDEAALAATLGVSRTPVREAIIQLIADGLVVRDGRKAKVAPLNFDEVPKLYDALLISSRMIQRLAAENRSDRDLARIEDCMLAFERAVDGSNGVERSEANVAFHKSISAAANNRYFSEFYEIALVGSIRLARACFANVGKQEETEKLQAHLAETARQHRLIFEAIKDHNVEMADRLAVLHYDLSKRRIEKVLFEGSQAFSGSPNLDLGNNHWEFS